MMQKIVLIFLFTITLLEARPKIGLVLSGGGARGGAHLGVIKELEKHHIPIDYIAGTSMGSFVGGLYASGKSTQEIEQMLTTTDWLKHIRIDYPRPDIPFRRKTFEYDFPGNLGLGVDVNGNVVLPTGVFKRQPLLSKFEAETEHVFDVHNFDDFRIPFRCVGTNITNGDAVVLKEGSLARSIYASSAIPGGFQPISIDGVDLVDGGVSDNIPIDVMRNMGADIIIAVDVSEGFAEHVDVNSYFVVMGQLVNILMRKNADEMIATMGDNEILLTPDLEGFTGIDADKYAPIIKRGEDVVQKNYLEQLKDFSLSDADYALYQERHQLKNPYKTPVIDAIRIENSTYISDDSILQRLHVPLGKTLDSERLRHDLMHIYNMMIFDSVDYRIDVENGHNTLVVITTPSWDNHGEIRFALGFSDNFEGQSDYSVKLAYTKFGLNAYGGEWRSQGEIGRRKLIYTELFQPLDPMQRYYIRPALSHEEKSVTVPSASGSDRFLLKRSGGILGVGAQVTTDYEFELGLEAMHEYGVSESDTASNLTQESRQGYAQVRTDSLDNYFFPKYGFLGSVKYAKEFKELNSDLDFEEIDVDMTLPLTYKAHTFLFNVKYGDTFNSQNNLQNSHFDLGGLFNLSGYPSYSFFGSGRALAVMQYRHSLTSNSFFDALSAPLYAGFSLEAGKVWKAPTQFNIDHVIKSASVYVAADTIMGPFYLAYGRAEGGEDSIYLYLGESF